MHSQKKKAITEILDLITRPIRDKEPIHTLYAYPAKFQASVPSLILDYFSDPGDLILDPFGGGGTTSAACLQKNRSSVHYDLNPIACLAALAKTTTVNPKDLFTAIHAIQKDAERTSQKLLGSDEVTLFGDSVSEVIEKLWVAVTMLASVDSTAAPLVACLMVKFLKAMGRRDAHERRIKSGNIHIAWFIKELTFYGMYFAQNPETKHQVICKSNHKLHLKKKSVSLIITSPPYPGVDIEYNKIQIQRRDLHRTYRSNVGVRIGNLFYAGDPNKQELCDGGVFNYFTNAEKSLKEMRRVLKLNGFAFIYCGFKTEFDKARYEKLLRRVDFDIIERGDVLLSSDRVASSRSTHHNKKTNLMKNDYLYIVK